MLAGHKETTYAFPKARFVMSASFCPRIVVIPASLMAALLCLLRKNYRPHLGPFRLSLRVGRLFNGFSIDMLPAFNVGLCEAVPAIEMIVDMVEPLTMRRTLLAGWLDCLLTKPTPKANLVVPVHVSFSKPCVEHGSIADAVIFFEVVLKGFSAITNFATIPVAWSVGRPLCTAPNLGLGVLGLFMPFPIILTAKLLLTVEKGTCVGFCMPLRVFSSPTIVSLLLGRERVAKIRLT